MTTSGESNGLTFSDQLDGMSDRELEDHIQAAIILAEAGEELATQVMLAVQSFTHLFENGSPEYSQSEGALIIRDALATYLGMPRDMVGLPVGLKFKPESFRRG